MRRIVLAVAPLVLGLLIGGLAGAARDQRKLLMQMDRDFDLATAQNGADGWASFFAEDGIMLPAGEKIVIGRKAIREHMAPRLAATSLRWEPTDADADGNLGYTYGVWKSTKLGPGGKPEFGYGKYVTIWKKQRDGSWKVVVDIANSSPPPK